jgi:histidinol phosphatase-like enzyme (inositol monophosphatase family)
LGLKKVALTLPMSFEKELDVAQRIADQAGRLAIENRARGFEQETKPDDSPVTSADRANEQLITKLLVEAFPDDGLLGEEGAAREARSGRRWIIDPIDGTRSFVRGIPTWGVMLALEAEGEVVVGACNLAPLSELYSAAKGLGAYCNGQRIHCSSAKTIGQAMLCLSGFDKVAQRSWGQQLLSWIPQFWSVRSMGGCMDAMCVASGRSEVWITMEAKSWDLAPLKIIGEEAGAVFFNLDGKSSIYGGNCVMTVPALENTLRGFLGIK